MILVWRGPRTECHVLFIYMVEGSALGNDDLENSVLCSSF